MADVDVEDLMALCGSEEYRESLAASSYYRQAGDDFALEQEHAVRSPVDSYVLAWQCVSDQRKRPYRTAVAEVMDNLLRVAREPVE